MNGLSENVHGLGWTVRYERVNNESSVLYRSERVSKSGNIGEKARKRESERDMPEMFGFALLLGMFWFNLTFLAWFAFGMFCFSWNFLF